MSVTEERAQISDVVVGMLADPNIRGKERIASHTKLLEEMTLLALERTVETQNIALEQPIGTIINAAGHEVFTEVLEESYSREYGGDFGICIGVRGKFAGFAILNKQNVMGDIASREAESGDIYKVCLAIDPEPEDAPQWIRKLIPLDKLEGPIYQSE